MFFGTWTGTEVFIGLFALVFGVLFLFGSITERDLSTSKYKRIKQVVCFFISIILFCLSITFFVGGWTYDFKDNPKTINEWMYIPKPEAQILTEREADLISVAYDLPSINKEKIIIVRAPEHTNFPQTVLAFILGVLASLSANFFSNKKTRKEA